MLKELRLSNGLSQSQLAVGSGVNIHMIQKYEQGVKDINHAKLETLLKLCNTLNCSLCELINDPKLEELVETYEARMKGDNNG